MATKDKFPRKSDGAVDVPTWLEKMSHQHHLKNNDLLKKSLEITDHACKGLTTIYGQPCLEQAMEMAEIILDLNLDQEAAAAAVVSSAAVHAHLATDTIKTELNENIAKLVAGISQMNVINNLANVKSRDQTQIDRLRKTLLAMVSDIRVVLIKLAERTSLMRGIKNINPTERKRLAQETMDLYAPLANRLGIGQLKWELEDIAFHYINPESYKSIAAFLAERRADRERRIHDTIAAIKTELEKIPIHAEISGRAKHIYSIYLKTQHKHLDLKNVYDSTAIRLLVPTLEDCYNALSVVHHLWEHIPDEFDDYISNPKPNGYRSIHTAVIGPENKIMEIQIRTKDMHNEAEHGVAAHWIYKEKKPAQSGYETKITFLRQLLAWHKDVAKDESTFQKINQQLFEDQVYVFTPAGDILDLTVGATPIDFAYHIHSNLGHRCRGAKVNGHIVPLTYTLQTGDQVDIIAAKEGNPSRDWLNKEFGFIKTARARAKVAQWFRQQEAEQYIESGKHILERELTRAGIHHPNLQKLAAYFHYKTDQDLLAAIGHSTVRPAQLIHAVQSEYHLPTGPITTHPHNKIQEKTRKSEIIGASDLLTRIARCCKPIPGDEIVGFITLGRGVSIHRKNCNNIRQLTSDHQNRFLDVAWDQKNAGHFLVDLQIEARGKEDLLKEISATLTHHKIDLITLNSTINKKNNMIYITMTVQIHEMAELKQLLAALQHLPNIIEVKRIHE